METFFIGIIIFLFVLAIFDLIVGVSNDAVNFLNSAVGSKAASFKWIITVAAIGIFLGATMSNGMMDIARHGIFRPENFYFQEIICILLAVMVTDVVLLDIFNTLGMPTSTTISMVFELLGGTFIIAFLKIMSDKTGNITFESLLNTEKALSVIFGIFVSVAIAFIVGALVQYISRIVFTFNYKKHLKYTIGIFGGVAITSILYFMIIKGIKGFSFITSENKAWINDNSILIIFSSFIVFTILMQILNYFKVNVLRIIVLFGTFALAMAFAGNDLVNFIGVPLAGLSSFNDFVTNGNNEPFGYLMQSLNEPAKTPLIFLFLSGCIMIGALIKSKKAHNVINTSVNLARQEEGDEMFGSSSVARNLVRASRNSSNFILKYVPENIKTWIDKRFNQDGIILENGAAFDMIRASVNLVLAGLLIALGTSLKLPLSTTYVTFTVAMGTSLADRAWGRDSAVFRITGVLSVIGGWFITAGVAFTLCAIITIFMYYGGIVSMYIMIGLALFILIRSNIKYNNKIKDKSSEDIIFLDMIASKNKKDIWDLLKRHVNVNLSGCMKFALETYISITDGFINEEIKALKKASSNIDKEKKNFKKSRRKEIIGLRKIDNLLAIEKNTWFHLGCNSCEQMFYCLKRIAEPCKEHVDNNFEPMLQEFIDEFLIIRNELTDLMNEAYEIIIYENYESADRVLKQGDQLKIRISSARKRQMNRIQEDNINMKTSLLYLNILQESQELVSIWRHLLRAGRMFQSERPILNVTNKRDSEELEFN